MRDFAVHDHPAIAAQLARIEALSLPQGRFGLETIQLLMARLDNPHRALPPVFHVAGTNGKGSTCAFLRAMLEADGRRVHVFNSPHLVRFNERIRLAGTLISDDALAAVLAEVLDISSDLNPSFFEVTTAAAFLAFARTPADACIIEVGLGGRFDATNVLEAPAVCGIASLGIDHEAFLLAPEAGLAHFAPLERIAFEKAGILKAGVPYATLPQPPAIAQIIGQQAEAVGAITAGPWQIMRHDSHFDFTSDTADFRNLPLPMLPGAHQISNAGLAIAMLLASPLPPGETAIRAGLQSARWPARLQRLSNGPLTVGLPDRILWLDGGHNPDAGAALGAHFAASEPLHLVIGMLANKDPRAIIDPLAGRIASITALPVPGHDDHPPRVFGDMADRLAVPFYSAANISDALAGLKALQGDILIAGSLYLAGEVLRLNCHLPD